MKKLVILFLPSLAFGADFTVPPDVTTTQTMNAENDVGTVEAGGSITTTNAWGVYMTADNQILTNAGTISSSGATSVNAVASEGANANITSSGVISATINDGFGFTNGRGIRSIGAASTITNNGSITVSVTSAIGANVAIGEGIGSTGASSIIINNGSITVAAIGDLDTANGVNLSSGANQMFINRGTVSATQFASALSAGGSSSTVLNYGTLSSVDGQTALLGTNCYLENHGSIISTSANSQATINSSSTGVSIVNTGTIAAYDPNSTAAIRLQAANGYIINSGKIYGILYALRLQGTNPTLSLKLGSNIEGPITVTAAPLNLIVEEGLNLRLTIDDASNGFGMLSIGSPYVTVGNTETIAVVDKTGLSLQADVLEDLSDSILDTIFRREYFNLHCCYPSCGGWVEGIGAYRKRTETIHYHDWVSGGLAGLNWPVLCGAAGFFAGGTYGEADIANDSQKADITTGLVGMTYEQMCQNVFIGFALTGGYVNWRNKRTVMNNLAPGGVQEARADVHGGFVSPEISVAGWTDLSTHFSTLLSGTIRYAGLFLGTYTESGSAADLTVKNRQVDLLKLRAELALSARGSCGCLCWNFDPYIGVAGRFQVGGTHIDAEMLDQPLDFSTGTLRNLAELLFGIRGEETYGPYTLFGNVQGLFDTKNSSRVLGELGLNYIF